MKYEAEDDEFNLSDTASISSLPPSPLEEKPKVLSCQNENLSQSSGCFDDEQLSYVNDATLASVNNGTPKIKVEADELMGSDIKSDISISPLIPLEPNFNTEDYLFSLDSSEGIADLFDVDSFL